MLAMLYTKLETLTCQADPVRTVMFGGSTFYPTYLEWSLLHI
jgi:hypothetical protein